MPKRILAHVGMPPSSSGAGTEGPDDGNGLFASPPPLLPSTAGALPMVAPHSHAVQSPFHLVSGRQEQSGVCNIKNPARAGMLAARKRWSECQHSSLGRALPRTIPDDTIVGILTQASSTTVSSAPTHTPPDNDLPTTLSWDPARLCASRLWAARAPANLSAAAVKARFTSRRCAKGAWPSNHFHGGGVAEAAAVLPVAREVDSDGGRDDDYSIRRHTRGGVWMVGTALLRGHGRWGTAEDHRGGEAQSGGDGGAHNDGSFRCQWLSECGRGGMSEGYKERNNGRCLWHSAVSTNT